MRFDKVISKIGFNLLIILAMIVSCEKDIEQYDDSSFNANKLERALMKSIENDTVFKKNEIQWRELSSYKMKGEGYFIAVPVISSKKDNIGKVMFEINKQKIYGKYLRYTFDSKKLISYNKQIDLTAHEVLQIFGVKKSNHLKSGSFPQECMLCHGGVILDPVDVYGDDLSDDWDDWDDYDYLSGGDDIVLPGGGIGGGVDGSNNDVNDPQNDICKAYNGVLDLPSIRA